ncbi:transcription termination factor NusA [Lachnoanaerobaculum gingivalis]|uniref:Transcription termination/antitermination protein NusA n=1 Tax=Lachnoanaerobaculum gingivalis TaxID=2490855 RepID=A0A3P3QZR9_9FIRM|nr:transcription termination factor NusA [Lachnoanaerobaculum gingivalis]RRJ26654.1 transcription termination/antitermination protein NusA [Lachnoanaerobaculum gingivalis]WHE86321.1 transcription termination factor NusA [Lachnoanaerobaculum gingivalis]
MNKELLEALDLLEKEKNISKAAILEAIENSLISACKNNFGTADNVKVSVNPNTCDYSIIQAKEVVDTLGSKPTIEDKATKISLADARMQNPNLSIGDTVLVPVISKEFGRIAAGVAKNVILQKIREEERKVIFNDYYMKERDIVSGVVTRFMGKNIAINLGRIDAVLAESEQVKGEELKLGDRLKVFVLEVKDNPKGPRISVSRTHPEFVKRLFESEVPEIRDGVVEIKSISREAGSRTKIAVCSHEADIDPVGACVGVDGVRVNAVVEELRGEKVDIVNWDENPGYLIENALSPAKVIAVVADEETKEADVIVPDYQLSLAIGKEGQNARLAARLTGYKIDIKSESQAREMGVFDSLDGSDDMSDDMPADERYTPDTEELDAEAETKDDNDIEE